VNFISNSTCLLTIREISNKYPNCIPQGLRKQKQTKSKIIRRKEIIKTRTEINEMEA
jgi:hypothetical protein